MFGVAGSHYWVYSVMSLAVDRECEGKGAVALPAFLWRGLLRHCKSTQRHLTAGWNGFVRYCGRRRGRFATATIDTNREASQLSF